MLSWLQPALHLLPLIDLVVFARKQHQSRGTYPRPQVAVVSSAPVDDPVVTVSQLESMFHRYMSQPSPVFSVTSDNKSWLLDSACCNHMTPHASHFS
jgi:hypothetical protein